jgi:hypothetical protein
MFYGSLFLLLDPRKERICQAEWLSLLACWKTGILTKVQENAAKFCDDYIREWNITEI